MEATQVGETGSKTTMAFFFVLAIDTSDKDQSVLWDTLLGLEVPWKKGTKS